MTTTRKRQGPRVHTHTDLTLASYRLLGHPVELVSACEHLERAVTHTDITDDERGLITSVHEVASALVASPDSMASRQAVRVQLARVLRSTAQRIKEREYQR